MDGDFRKNLAILINQHSLENGSDTPDWRLAQYLALCLEAFDAAMETPGEMIRRTVLTGVFTDQGEG